MDSEQFEVLIKKLNNLEKLLVLNNEYFQKSIEVMQIDQKEDVLKMIKDNEC
jgi:hypothetical protein